MYLQHHLVCQRFAHHHIHVHQGQLTNSGVQLGGCDVARVKYSFAKLVSLVFQLFKVTFDLVCNRLIGQKSKTKNLKIWCNCQYLGMNYFSDLVQQFWRCVFRRPDDGVACWVVTALLLPFLPILACLKQSNVMH